VRQRHVASLGAVTLDREQIWLTVRERSEIWQQLHEQIRRLALDGGKAGKIMTALQARVPLPTIEEIGAAELAEAEHEAAFWGGMHKSSAKQVEGYQEMIAVCERKIGEHRELMKQEADKAETAKATAARLANYRGG